MKLTDKCVYDTAWKNAFRPLLLPQKMDNSWGKRSGEPLRSQEHRRKELQFCPCADGDRHPKIKLSDQCTLFCIVAVESRLHYLYRGQMASDGWCCTKQVRWGTGEAQFKCPPTSEQNWSSCPWRPGRKENTQPSQIAGFRNSLVLLIF